MSHVAVHIREAKVPAGVTVGQLGVIQAHLMKDGGVEIMEVGAVLNGGDSVFVGGTVAESAFDAAAGHEE